VELCCQICYENINCVSYLLSGSNCLIYEVGDGYGAGQTSLECPSGLVSNSETLRGAVDSYDMVRLGPCGTP
jgi:hypothetical protein